VKNAILQRYPDVASAVFDAFTEAKQRYVARLLDGDVSTDADRMYVRVLEITGADPLPYGVEPNRLVLETLMEFALAQRILTRPVDIDEMFAA
jgi:4,5-dihydroxyphthalate decarboxylase